MLYQLLHLRQAEPTEVTLLQQPSFSHAPFWFSTLTVPHLLLPLH